MNWNYKGRVSKKGGFIHNWVGGWFRKGTKYTNFFLKNMLSKCVLGQTVGGLVSTLHLVACMESNN